MLYFLDRFFLGDFMAIRQFTFSATEAQLEQLRYALIHRFFELKRLLAVGDSDEEHYRSSLVHTEEIAQILKLRIG